MLPKHLLFNLLSSSSTRYPTFWRRQWSRHLAMCRFYQEHSPRTDSRLFKALHSINTSFSKATKTDWWWSLSPPTCILQRIESWDLKCLSRRTATTRFISVSLLSLYHIVNTAIATTDIPSNLNILIRQRRRWLNGSFFAGLYALKEWSRLYTESGHSIGRKLLLTLQLVYMSVNLCFDCIHFLL